ncbi:MAG TPA: alpha/beta fold hydrolase [Solirubrobacteraceae bacterium]|nr:alpha/beta fold hydrolase [Solirubrobacteraceae bacterium]
MKLVRTAVAACAATACLLGAASAAADYPVVYDFPAGVAATETGHPLAGANDWSCKPSAEHPNPVVLVPGLSGSSGRDYQAAAPLLANNGYCVFAYDFSDNGFESNVDAAAGLSSFVDRVLASTGASKVDLVGHSQGGMMPRYYLAFLGGASKVGTLAAISPVSHGTTLFGVGTLVQQVAPAESTVSDHCPACSEDTAGSPFMQQLNAAGDTVPGVRYTVIGTRYDEIITPNDSQYLSGRHVTNIVLQDQCPVDAVDHLASSYDSIALQDVLNALDPEHARQPDCHPVLPGVGG